MRLGCKRQDERVSLAIHGGTTVHSGWLVLPSVGCFPCREQKRRVGGSGKRRDSQNRTNSNQELKKTPSREQRIAGRSCLCPCEMSRCVVHSPRRVGSRGSLVRGRWTGLRRRRLKFQNLGRGTQHPAPNKVASQSQTGLLRLCQVVGSCYDVLLWEWFLGGRVRRPVAVRCGCERDEVLRLMFSVVWLVLCPGCHVSTSSAQEGREETSCMLFAATLTEGIAAGAYGPARGRGCGRRF